MEVIKFKVPDVVTAIGMLESSLKRELFLLDKSIFDTKKKLKDFEDKSNGLQSKDFIEKFNKGLAGDNPDTMLWAAEYEALELLEKERDLVQKMLSQCK